MWLLWISLSHWRGKIQFKLIHGTPSALHRYKSTTPMMKTIRNWMRIYSDFTQTRVGTLCTLWGCLVPRNWHNSALRCWYMLLSQNHWDIIITAQHFVYYLAASLNPIIIPIPFIPIANSQRHDSDILSYLYICLGRHIFFKSYN